MNGVDDRRIGRDLERRPLERRAHPGAARDLGDLALDIGQRLAGQVFHDEEGILEIEADVARFKSSVDEFGAKFKGGKK